MTLGNVAGGHKANLNNPNTSEASKQHSKEVLEKELDGGDVGITKQQDDGTKNPKNVAGGLKATINNPNVSEDAKESAKQRLNDM